MKHTEIFSVEVKPGSYFGRGWRKPMQIVHTRDGEFIDNMPGVSFGSWVGHSWDNEVGEIVDYKTVTDSGYEWIEYKGASK